MGYSTLLRWKSRPAAIAGIGLLVLGAIAWGVTQGSSATARHFYPLPASGSQAALSSHSSQEPRVGSLAPDFQLNDAITGRAVGLSALRGRPVWINFWATWCEACKVEMPVMKQLYDKYKSRGLALVGVDMREDPVQLRDFTKAYGYDWTFVIDADVQVRDRYYTTGIPMHFFIDADGIIQGINVGDLQGSAMEGYLAKIVGE